MAKVTKNEKRRTGSAIYCAGLDAGILAFKLGEIKDILEENGESCSSLAAALQEKVEKVERELLNFFNDYERGKC